MNQKQLKQKARNLKQSIVDSRQHDISIAKTRLFEARRGNYLMCAKALNVVEGLGHEVRNYYITVSDDRTAISIRITVKSLKDDLMLNTLAALEVVTGKELVSSVYVNEWSQEVNYRSGDRWDDAFSVNLECNIASDSATCRKVVVGTKMVAEKTYELQCD